METDFLSVFDPYPVAVAAERGGRICYCNPALTALFGRSGLGRRSEELFGPALTRFEGASFTGSLTVGGREAAVAVTCSGDTRIYSVFTDGAAPEEDPLAFSAGGAIRSSAAIMQMAVNLLRPRVDALGDEKLSAYACMLSQNCRQMIRLAEHLSILSGGIPEAPDPAECQMIDLGEICGELVRSLQAFELPEGVALVSEVPDSAVLFTGPPARIEQMLMNLISNSLKFTPAGGRVRVTVSQAQGGPRIAVADTGSGIPGGRLRNIFHSYRARGELDDPRIGVGLGLAAAKKIAEYLGGVMLLESAAGKGTTVTVMLPNNTDRAASLLRSPYIPTPAAETNGILTEMSDVLGYRSYSPKFED